MALLLEAHNLSHAFHNQDLFTCKQLQIFSGDKIGLIGANGSGKSTLLNILFGSLTPDQGTVRHLCPISYFSQSDQPTLDPDDEQLRRYHVTQKVMQSHVSGGEKTRIHIAQTLHSAPPLFFADEISTNLDQNARQLLLHDLHKCETLLIVSHDRDLLDQLCTRIIAIEDGVIRQYQGNYSDYLQRKQQEINEAQCAYDQYRKEKKRLKNSVTHAKQRAHAMHSAPSRMGNSEARLHKGEVKNRQKVVHRHASVLQHRLEALAPKYAIQQEHLSFDFALTHPLTNKWVIQADNHSFAYPDQPPLYEHASFVLPNGSKTALYGGNGSGKTTLIKEIIAQHNGIHIVPQAKLGIFHQDFTHLDTTKTLLENAMLHSVRSESIVRAILSGMGFNADDYAKYTYQLSDGERVKLSLCSIFASQANLLILDEPTNFLDLLALETLEQMLHTYPGTVLFVSHDPTLVKNVATRLLILENQRLITHEGNLASYRSLTHDFT